MKIESEKKSKKIKSYSIDRTLDADIDIEVFSNIFLTPITTNSK